MRDREGIKGLTTAASLWLVAGIGLAVGCGFYKAGVYATILALIVLLFLRYLEWMMFPENGKNKEEVKHGL